MGGPPRNTSTDNAENIVAIEQTGNNDTELNTQEEVKYKVAVAQNSTVKELTEQGHVIGNKNQKLSEGHDESGLQKWEKWEIELRLKPVMRDGKETGVPYEFYAVKLVRPNIVGDNKTFQQINKQVDYRLTSRPNYHVYHFPAGSVEAGKTYACSTYFETVGKGVSEKSIERILFVSQEAATKA